MSTSDKVAQLATMCEIAVSEVETHIDWQAFESALGVPLPSDYKQFIDRFPPGRFGKKLRPHRPPNEGDGEIDYLFPLRHIMTTMREWRAEGSGVFPYPIFPEANGILPWATGAEGVYFWLTEGQDPDTWPIVWSNLDYTQWERYPPRMVDFIIAKLAAGDLPPFVPSNQRVARTFSVGNNESPRWSSLSAPRNESDALIAAINPGPDWAKAHDWARIESDLGVRLPLDYKTFIDLCGVGQFCGIDIGGPDPCRGYDMNVLQAKQIAAAARTGLTRHISFHPSPRGLLCWGFRSGAFYFNWRMGADDDPEKWSVSVLSSSLRTVQDNEELSFSTFLLRYSGVAEPRVRILGEPEWAFPLRFTPHECR